MNILLIDKRVSRYEDIVAAIDPALAVGIVFDYDTDTFETIKVRISEALSGSGSGSGSGGDNIVISGASASTSVSVGLIQHNYNAPTFSMVAAAAATAETDSSQQQQQQQQQQPSCIVAQVETLDPALESWAQFKDFIVWCKTECGAAHFDMMACALYSNPDWKYIADTLPKQTGVDVRASTDDTGSAALGGNWFLESHAGVNLKAVYFTELIETYRGVLGGSLHSLFITSTGAVYATGNNYYGALGLGDNTTRDVPTLITSGIGSLNIIAVSAGSYHSLFLTNTGTVYATGLNSGRQLGLGDSTDRNVPTLITSGIGSLNIVAVSAGDNHSLFLTNTGAVYATGSNSQGALGLGDNTLRNVPTLITSVIGSLTIIAVSAGLNHSLFLTNTGTVYATGWNVHGQLGLGDSTDRNVPTLITSNIGSLYIAAISAGTNHSLFLTANEGFVYAAGGNYQGALGLGDTSNRNVPSRIYAFEYSKIIAISAGGNHSLFIMSTGAVYSTGYNVDGRLGLGDTTDRNVPTLITTNIGSLNIVSVLAGYAHSLFLTSTGTVYTAGSNYNGIVPTLMSGTYSRLTDSNSGLANFVSVGQGYFSTIYYSYDGIMWTAARDSYSIFSTYGRGVAYSAQLNRWVAVGTGTNSIAYSNDGITWTGLGLSIINGDVMGVAYSAEQNRWVAVGAPMPGSNSIVYSTDGITWTGLGSSIFSQGYDVAYSAELNRWVAVGYETNTIAYSSDGITWTGIGSSIFSTYAFGVAYSAQLSRWVAVGQGTNSIAYSTDGITWTGIGTSIFSNAGYGVAYSAELSRWVAGGAGTTNTIAYSTDGITWTGIGKSIFSSDGRVESVAYSAELNRWVAVGAYANSIAYSIDGITWTGLGTPVFSTGYGVAAKTTLLPAKYVSVGNGTNSIAYSYDGITWTGSTNSTSIFSTDGRSVAYSTELNRWVAVGNGTNTIAYSTDGITWTGLGTSIFSSYGLGVAYSVELNRWVTVGNGTNTIAYSTDGITWTGLGTSIFSNYGLGVAYSVEQNRWVAVGQGTNSIAYSTDGITWTGSTNSTSIFSTHGFAVAYSAQLNRWVAVGQGTNTIAYSTDGITWTVSTNSTSIFSNGCGVAYSAELNRWVAVGQGNSIAYSTDGITWTGLGTSIFSTYGLGVAYSAELSRWVAGGSGTSTIAYSTDGITWTGLGTSIFSNYGYGVAAKFADLAEITLSAFAVPSSKTMADAPFSITTAPTSASDGAITYTSLSPGVATINVSTGVITLVGAGDVIFRATQAATSTYASDAVESNTLTVALATSAFSSATFTVPSSGTYGAGTLSITTAPSSASDGAITYASSNTGVATIHATTGVITMVAAGEVYFIATQAATAVYAASTRNSGTLTVALATSAFASATFAVPATKTNVDAPFSITTAPSSASDGAITYASNNTAVATINVSTGQITIVAAGGPMYFTATQAATSTYASATVDSNTLTVSIVSSLAGQTLTGNLAGKDFTGTSFAGATIQSGVSLAGSTLTGANFTGATLSGVNFASTAVSGTNFTNANIVGATNLPEFSTAQKLQLLRNAYNVAIGAVQFSTTITGADINAAITAPVPAIAGATFVVKAPSYNGSGEKVITVISTDVSGNASIYIPLNDNETVKINGVAYTFNGTDVLDASGSVVRFLTILDAPYRLYAGSIIGLNITETLNGIKYGGVGLYDIFAELFVFKN